MKSNECVKPVNILMLLIAGVINAAGVILLLNPSSLIDSGVSGLSMFISGVTGLPIAVFLVAVNIPLFLIGFKKSGWKFIVYSLIAIGSYSLWSYLFQDVFKIDLVIRSLIGSDMFVAAVFGGLVSGIGSGMTIRYGGAIDGVEVLAVTFAKKIGLSVGQFVMAFNLIIYTLASVFDQSLLIGLYSVVSYVVGLKVVDFIVDGFDKGKACFIITSDAEALASLISALTGKGITVIDCEGYYSKSENKMLYCVVNRFELTKIKNLIESVDPEAFLSVSEVSEVSGNRIKLDIFQMRRNKRALNLIKDAEREDSREQKSPNAELTEAESTEQ